MTVVVSFIKPRGAGVIGLGKVRVRENLALNGTTTAQVQDGEVVIIGNGETGAVAVAWGTAPDAAATTETGATSAGFPVTAGTVSYPPQPKIGDKINVKAVVSSPPASYVGPGDVVAGAFAWYGLRGYSAAYSNGSNPAIDIVDQAGGNPLTVNILANGRLDVASINGWVTANSVSTIKVARLYDQSGNARHQVQATLANMPVLNLTGLASLPTLQFTAANSHRLTSSSTASFGAQPFTVSVVFNNAVSTGSILNAGGSVIIARLGTNQLRMSAGTAFDSTVSDAANHAVQVIFNGASSARYLDGVSATGNAGTSTLTANAFSIGGPSGGYSGSISETGIWTGVAFATSGGGQADLMNANQHGSNGYSF